MSLIDCSNSNDELCKKNNEKYVVVRNQNKIESKCKITFDEKNEMHQFFCDFPAKHSEIILNTISNSNLKNLWAFVKLNHPEFEKIIYSLASHGWNYPFLCDKCPLGENIPLSVAMYFENKNNDVKTTILKVKYVLKHRQLDHCVLHVKLDDETIQFLRKIPKTKEKEFTGTLIIKKLEIIEKEIVHILMLDKETLKEGEDENVDVKSTLYNFHTHPEKAYKRHNVEKAWPSITDYLGYLMIGKSTLFHIVATLEGIYIISFGRYWGKRVKEIQNKKTKKYIKKTYNHDRQSSMTPDEYVNAVNKLKYNEHALFVLSFHDWKHADSVFNIEFAKNKNNCFSCEKTKKLSF